MVDLLGLIRDLFPFDIGVVKPDNAAFFARLGRELPLTLHRFASGQTHNGWLVPQQWSVKRATIRRGGKTLFDGTQHPMAVATYSKSFSSELTWEQLQPHLITRPKQPEAYLYHCMWQYRPWDADWVLSVPYRTYKKLGRGKFQVDLETVYEPGEMIVATVDHPGESDRTIVFNAHTCHPRQANDDLAGVAILIRLFQWLRGRKTRYTYRLVLAPEHVGTVFYLRDCKDIGRMVAGAFAEMPGTTGPIRIASTFRGGGMIDRAFANAALGTRHACVPWRQGAGNDETVWEAPGYEVPFVEVSRSAGIENPYPEYHTSRDTPELMNAGKLQEFFELLQRVVNIFEDNATLHRNFTGLICLSNPQYDLYLERPDPSVAKNLPPDSEQWGHLLDCLLRYFDGSMTVLDIAEKHALPFDRLHHYLKRFEAKKLVRFEFAPCSR